MGNLPVSAEDPESARRRATPPRDPCQRSAADDGLDQHLLLHLAAVLHREARHFGRGTWRVVIDAIDLTVDRVIDRMMRPAATHPRDWVAFTIEIYRNAVRKGPGRAELSKHIGVRLGEEHLLVPAPDPEPTRAKPKVTLEELLRASLTAAERAAVTAWWNTGGIRAAAALLGQTPRDVRVRVRRAIEKFRREFC